MSEPERPRGVTRRALAPRRPVRYDDRGDGWTLAAELVTATFVWGGIGWLADRLLGTGPVLMAIGFVLGNALGIYLIWLRSQDRFEREHADLLRTRTRREPVTGDAAAAPAHTGSDDGSSDAHRGDRDPAGEAAVRQPSPPLEEPRND